MTEVHVCVYVSVTTALPHVIQRGGGDWYAESGVHHAGPTTQDTYDTKGTIAANYVIRQL